MKKYLVVALTFISSLSFGANHELLGGTSAAFRFGNGTSVAGSLGYNYTVVPAVQIGLLSEIAYSKASGATNGATAFQLLAGPTINFPFAGNLGEAFFLFGGAGFTHASLAGTSATEFTFGFLLGKRFQIVPSVCYRPNVGLLKVSGSDVTFNVTPLAFSFLF